MLKNNYDRSMEIINQFIMKEHDELNAINKYDKSKIKSITFYEYLNILKKEFKKNIINYVKK